MTLHTKKQKNNHQSGFTLIEFIVVLVIFAIMSTVSIFNYNGYRRSIQETNIAQDIALSIRQAQVYGISSSGGNIGDNTDPGDLFSTSIPDITDDRSIRGVAIDSVNNTIIIFEDINRDFVYTSSGPSPDRIIDSRTILTGRVGILGVDLCNTSANCGDVETAMVHIAFRRPYSEAYISLDGSPSATFDFASILIGESTPYNRYIEVNAIGNISVKQDYVNP